MINVYIQPNSVQLSENEWWFVVTAENIVMSPPRQSNGAIFSHDTLVVADTLEECHQYILDNNLEYTPDDD